MREWQGDAFEHRELLVIAIHHLASSLVVSCKLTELYEAQRRAHLINTVIKPGGHDVVTKTVATVTIPGQTRHPVRAQQFNTLGKFVTVCRQHAAFASGEIFIGEEAKAANITNAATLFEDSLAPTVRSMARQRHPTAGSWGVRHIFHHIQSMALCQCHDTVHVTTIASGMHHADALGSRVNTGGDALWRDVTVRGARNIGKDRGGTGITNGVGRGHESQ